MHRIVWWSQQKGSHRVYGHMCAHVIAALASTSSNTSQLLEPGICRLNFGRHPLALNKFNLCSKKYETIHWNRNHDFFTAILREVQGVIASVSPGQMITLARYCNCQHVDYDLLRECIVLCMYKSNVENRYLFIHSSSFKDLCNIMYYSPLKAFAIFLFLYDTRVLFQYIGSFHPA